MKPAQDSQRMLHTPIQSNVLPACPTGRWCTTARLRRPAAQRQGVGRAGETCPRTPGADVCPRNSRRLMLVEPTFVVAKLARVLLYVVSGSVCPGLRRSRFRARSRRSRRCYVGLGSR